jgi:hypothetical protein
MDRLKSELHMLKMFSPRPAKHQNIVEKYKHEFAEERLQNIIHESLKS